MEAPVTFDHLCEICKSIFDDQTFEYILSNGATLYTEAERTIKTNSDAIIRSAEESCHLCNMLFHSCERSYQSSLSQSRGTQVKLIRLFVHDFLGGRLVIQIKREDKVGGLSVASISRIVSGWDQIPRS